MEGYNAISNVSKEQNKWVKRNADVLVQLLQSDEPEEIEVVQKALAEHLDMDPLATLSVLCDQIVPPDDISDEDDQIMRERLRLLVLDFLNVKAKRVIVERHANKAGNPCEKLLINCMLQTVLKLPKVTSDPSDTTTAVVDILQALPTFRTYSQNGDTIVRLLTDHIKIWSVPLLAEDAPEEFAAKNSIKIQTYLTLINKFLVERPAARSEHYLRYISNSLGGKMAQLPTDLQKRVFADLAVLFTVVERTQPPPTVMRNIRASIAEVSSALLGHFLQTDSHDWDSCATLMRACAAHILEANWSPARLEESLRAIERRAMNELEADSSRKSSIAEAIPHIRSLLAARSKSPQLPTASSSKLPVGQSETATTGAKGRTSNGRSNGGPPVLLHRNRQGFPASLPPKPSVSVLNASHAPDANGSSSTPGRSSERWDTGGGSSGTPSLLSRLNSDTTAAPARPPSASSTSSVPSKRRREAEAPAPRSSSSAKTGSVVAADRDVDMIPTGGFSIKGAASKMAAGRSESSSFSGQQSSSGRHSLLERMNNNGERERDPQRGDGGDRRGKKRTKNA